MKVDHLEYHQMLEGNDGSCDSCGSPIEGERQRHVDHDHQSGALRGVLCVNCNVALGHAKDDQARLHDLGTYLARHQFDLLDLCRAA